MLRIDEILREKAISNSSFASMIGVSETSASAFKSGKTISFDKTTILNMLTYD